MTIDQDTVNREYLEAMEWDVETTRPRDAKLVALGLADVVGAI